MTYETRLLELEDVLEKCSKAFDLLPLNALEKGQTWIPSAVAVHLLKVAKDSLRDYLAVHWHGSPR